MWERRTQPESWDRADWTRVTVPCRNPSLLSPHAHLPCWVWDDTWPGWNTDRATAAPPGPWCQHHQDHGVTTTRTITSQPPGPWCHCHQDHGVSATRTMVSTPPGPWCHSHQDHGVTATQASSQRATAQLQRSLLHSGVCAQKSSCSSALLHVPALLTCRHHGICAIPRKEWTRIPLGLVTGGL